MRSTYDQFRKCVAKESHTDNEFTDCLDWDKLSDDATRKDHLVACAEQSSNSTLLVVEQCNMLWIRPLVLGCYSDLVYELIVIIHYNYSTIWLFYDLNNSNAPECLYQRL